MAVEARQHLNPFPSQLLGSREAMTTTTMMNPIEANGNMVQAQMGYGVPLSGTAATTTTEGLLPFYNSLATDSITHNQKAAAAVAAAAVAIKSDSSLTYNNLPLPRKRSRDSMTPNLFFPSPVRQPNNNNINNRACLSPFSFLGHDISLQMEQQQLDIDRLISQHMEKVRMEIEERRKRQSSKIMAVIEERVMKRLRAKEEEIENIGKLNWALEEKVRSLCIDNQIWRNLAQSNEATANALRTNLEQVLATTPQVKVERAAPYGEEVAAADDEVDDAQSCCGSSWEEERKCSSRVCKNCRKEESCVLLLPCRHLCLCSVCGSNLHICPICKSTKNGSFLVNLS